METPRSKVYALPNAMGYITNIDGGYTIGNITTSEDWVLIDEGYGDKYNLCQSNYLPQPLRTDGGAWRYKLVDGKPVECTAEEIAAQEEANKPEVAPSTEDRLKELESQNQMLMECLLEMSETVYA